MHHAVRKYVKKKSNLNAGKRNALNTEQVREGQIHSRSPNVDTNVSAHSACLTDTAGLNTIASHVENNTPVVQISLLTEN